MTIFPSITVSKNTLSPKEMFDISQEISRKYSPLVSVRAFGFTKGIALTAKELLEVSEDISRKYMPKLNSKIAKLVVLPIDPTHLYVSWNTGQIEIKPTIKDESKAIVLRIYPETGETIDTAKPKPWFDVDLDQTKAQQKVLVPQEHLASTYTATIGLCSQDNHLTAFATAKAKHIPRDNMVVYASNEKGILSTLMPQRNPSNQDRSENIKDNASGQGIK